jgi:hypothetical protein
MPATAARSIATTPRAAWRQLRYFEAGGMVHCLSAARPRRAVDTLSGPTRGRGVEPMAKLVKDAGFRIERPDTGYMRRPRPMTFMRPRTERAGSAVPSASNRCVKSRYPAPNPERTGMTREGSRYRKE